VELGVDVLARLDAHFGFEDAEAARDGMPVLARHASAARALAAARAGGRP
jgi:hypothetical protein